MNTKFNSVVISESCLSALPPGRYHYSIFKGIDIFVPRELSYGDLLEIINEQEKEMEKLRGDADELDRNADSYMGQIEDMQVEIDELREKLREFEEKS